MHHWVLGHPIFKHPQKYLRNYEPQMLHAHVASFVHRNRIHRLAIVVFVPWTAASANKLSNFAIGILWRLPALR